MMGWRGIWVYEVNQTLVRTPDGNSGRALLKHVEWLTDSSETQASTDCLLAGRASHFLPLNFASPVPSDV